MQDSPIGKWFPFNIDWFRRASASWDPAWVLPVLNILMDMWPNGCALENRDEALARTARVPVKTWLSMREEMGSFWAVMDGKFTQPFLAAQYADAMERAEKWTERARKGGLAKHAKAQERLAKEIAAAASSTSQAVLKQCLSNTTSTSSSTPEALLEAHTRAYVGFSSDKEDRREDPDLRASAAPKPEYVEACFRAYPRTRRGKGATARTVAIPEDARERIALFLLPRPGYPLLEAFEVIARDHDFPPAMADFLAEPWDAETVRRAHQGAPKAGPAARETGPERDARMLREAEDRAEAEWLALPPEERARREAMMAKDFPRLATVGGRG